MSESCEFLFICHRWILPDGGVKLGSEDRTKDYLIAQGRTIAMLEHPLTTVAVDYDIPTRSRLWLLRGKDRRLLEEFEVVPSGSPWRWLFEGSRAVRAAARHLSPGFVVIAADPLSGLAGLAMKKRGLAARCVFYSLDYADRRMSNPILNTAYQVSCARNLRRSDLVLCVSRRMMDRFEHWHPDGTYMFFPNTPAVADCPREPVERRNRSDLVLLGVGADDMRHDMVLSALAILAKRQPTARLHVIGGGGGERALAEGAARMGIGGMVQSHGFMEWTAGLALTASSGIGIVAYDNRVPWNQYRDSLKIREYAACGLPIVCDSSTSTAQEAASAGAALLADTAGDFAEALEKLMSDGNEYRRASARALDWARINDKRTCNEALAAKFDSWKEHGR